MKRKSKSSSSSTTMMNNTLIMVILGLILFGLGVVVGKAGAKMKYFGEFTMMKDQLMLDRTYQSTMVEKMMKDDTMRQVLMKAVDDYRSTMMKK